MENPLKPQPLAAEILPGFAMIVPLAWAYGIKHKEVFQAIEANRNAINFVGGGILALFVSWILGAFLDTVRDIMEKQLDRKFPVNWAYLLNEPSDKIQSLHDSWLAYYFMSFNFALALIFAAALGNSFDDIRISPLYSGLMLATASIFLYDSWLLREEIRALIGFKPTNPHEGVYTRIQVSTVPPSAQFKSEETRGVGVFAIRRIPSGARVFGPDDGMTVKVSKAIVDSLELEVRRLYDDFCPLTDEVFTCPASFNEMTISWYLNDSEEPNVKTDDKLHFRATRDIEPGEELLARYRDYCE